MDRKEFIKAYGNLARKVWTDEGGIQDKLTKNPEQVLKDNGLDPKGAKVNLHHDMKAAEGGLEVQIQSWQQGEESGEIDFYLPFKEPEDFDDTDLSDQELQSIAGGSGDCCCCCTPCCSCC